MVLIIIPIVPILWILNTSVIYLILVPSLLNGISWAGLHLAERNFIYDNVNPQKRGLAISYYNMFWGVGVFLGAGLGAILIKFLEISIVEPIIAIFIIGSILRMIAVSWWIPKIKEIKKRRKIKSFKEIEDVILKEARPTILEEVHEIMSIRKYIKKK